MNFIFKGWSGSYREVVNEPTLKKVQKTFEKDQLINFLIGEEDHPVCHSHLKKSGFTEVFFIDNFKRDNIDFNFDKSAKFDKLFMGQVYIRSFKSDSKDLWLGESYIFNEEGDWRIITRNYIEETAFEKTAKNKIDVSNFYIDIPEFGKYEELIKKCLEHINRFTPEGFETAEEYLQRDWKDYFK
jgi:hypothetical protein